MQRAAFMWMALLVLVSCGGEGLPGTLVGEGAQDGNVVAVGSSQQTGPTPAAGSPNGNASAGDANQAAGSSASSGNNALACPQDANDPYASVRIACVQQINAYRATLGLSALGRWCGEAACIDRQTQTDGTQQRAHSAFGACHESAQNECPSWPTPLQQNVLKCEAQMWAEGPGTDFSAHGHYINMTSQKYTRVECGLYVTGDSFWAAMDFH